MNELTTTEPRNPFALATMGDAEKMAGWIAESGCFGIKKPAQALTLMLLAHEESSTLSKLLRRVHVFDTGQLSQRADYTQSVFEQNGTIIWHVRTSAMVAATFFATKTIDDEARNRAKARFKLQWSLDAALAIADQDDKLISKLMMEVSDLAHEGEATIIRTFADCQARGITEGKSGTKTNWQANAVSMLQWRCVTDGVKLIAPEVLSGLSSDADLQDSITLEQHSRPEGSTPKDRYRAAIQAIIDQHLEDAKTADPARKAELLGLAAELRCKLADETVTDTNKAQVKMTKEIAADQPVPESIDKQKGEVRSVDATDAVVEPPETKEVAWPDYTLKSVKAKMYREKPLGGFTKEEIEVLFTSSQKKLTAGNTDPDVVLDGKMISEAKAEWDKQGGK